MKRGQPMRRGKPLRRRTPLTSSSSLSRGSSVLPAVSAKRRGQQPERRRVVLALVEAQHGRCARCRRADRVLHGHELLGMAQGADYTRPDVAVCDPCNGAIEDDPVVSAWNGWKISSRHPHDPMLPLGVARDLHGGFVVFAALDPSTLAALVGDAS